MHSLTMLLNPRFHKFENLTFLAFSLRGKPLFHHVGPKKLPVARTEASLLISRPTIGGQDTFVDSCCAIIVIGGSHEFSLEQTIKFHAQDLIPKLTEKYSVKATQVALAVPNTSSHFASRTTSLLPCRQALDRGPQTRQQSPFQESLVVQCAERGRGTPDSTDTMNAAGVH